MGIYFPSQRLSKYLRLPSVAVHQNSLENRHEAWGILLQIDEKFWLRSEKGNWHFILRITSRHWLCTSAFTYASLSSHRTTNKALLPSEFVPPVPLGAVLKHKFEVSFCTDFTQTQFRFCWYPSNSPTIER